MNIFLTRIKILLKTKANLFWALIFPLLLGTFFHFSFGGLSFDNELKTIKIHISSESANSNDQFSVIMMDILTNQAISDEKMLFDVNATLTEVELIEEFNDENNDDVVHYLTFDNNEVNYYILSNGLNQTITKSVIDQILQYFDIINNTNPTEEQLPQLMADLSKDLDLVKEEVISSNSSANSIVIYFYALIAMVSLYSALWGFNLVTDIQANQSNIAFRVSVAPTPKIKLVLIYFLAAFVVSFFGNMILLFYLRFILNVDLGNFGLVTLVVLMGTIAGMSLGGFVGVTFKGSSSLREGIMSSFILLLSAMSGLMNSYLKFAITSNMPILGYINPANLIVDALNSLYYFNDLKIYNTNMALLGVFSALMITYIVIRMRGVKYDSI